MISAAWTIFIVAVAVGLVIVTAREHMFPRPVNPYLSDEIKQKLLVTWASKRRSAGLFTLVMTVTMIINLDDRNWVRAAASAAMAACGVTEYIAFGRALRRQRAGYGPAGV